MAGAEEDATVLPERARQPHRVGQHHTRAGGIPRRPQPHGYISHNLNLIGKYHTSATSYSHNLTGKYDTTSTSQVNMTQPQPHR